MKRILFAFLFALGCLGAQAQSLDKFYELSLDGKPWFRFGSQADCDSGVINNANHPEVKAKGTAEVIFDCKYRIRLVPAPTKPPATTPPVVGQPANDPVVQQPATQPTTVARGMTPACDAVVAKDFKAIEGTANPEIPALSKPVRGVATKEPAFGTCLVRATDMNADSNRKGDFVRNDYSRRQAFNADSSMYFAYEYNGEWLLYDTKTQKKLGTLAGAGADAELQWSATDPDLYYYTGTNGYGMALYERSISKGTYRTVGDFGSRLKAKWPSAFFVWTKSEGSPSKDGRYWCFMVDDANWKGLGLFTYDSQTDKIIAMADHPGGMRPDSVSMSPSGNYCAWYGDQVRAFTRDLASNKALGTAEHSDLALDADGKDVLVSVDYSSAGNGVLYATSLETGVRKSVIPSMYLNGTATALHVSGKGYGKPGWFVLSTYADYDTWNPPQGRQWMHRKIMAVEMKTGKVLQLGHTRSMVPTNRDDRYWSEPHATVNRDFTKILFTSNWGVDGLNVEAYMLQFPADSIK